MPTRFTSDPSFVRFAPVPCGGDGAGVLDEASKTPDNTALSVAELDRRLKAAVESTSMDVWVRGEIGGLKLAASGHAYFTLKDEQQDALIDAVAYRPSATRLRGVLSEGARVIVRGKATIWAPKGKLQFVVETARPAGRGALLEALEALKQKLRSEGLFEPERKKCVPKDARLIGVVTSASGAVIHDIVRVAFRRGAASILLSPAVVQGDEAPLSIVQALDKLQRVRGLDVIIVGRGGGSIEDLMAFNDERVVRKIAACPVPVVAAVGHEVDVTLTDLVADARASTPSQAAELVVADQQAFAHSLRQLHVRMTRAMRATIKDSDALLGDLGRRLGRPEEMLLPREQRVDDLVQRAQKAMEVLLDTSEQTFGRLQRRLVAQHPQTVLASAQHTLQSIAFRLRTSIMRRLQTDRQCLVAQQNRLEALSPVAVLARGYAIALGPDDAALVDASQVKPGNQVRVILHAGSVDTQVLRCNEAVLADDS